MHQALQNLLTCGIAITALLAVGCSEESDPPPAEVLQEGLDQAKSAIGDMEDKSEKLQDDLQEKAGELKDLAQKQVNLIQSQLDGLGDKIATLPAEAEPEFQKRLDELRTQASEAQKILKEYAAEASAEAGPAWDKVKAKVDTFADQFESFKNDLSDAQE
jgi:uncharacterized coiled-coil protein SlyX